MTGCGASSFLCWTKAVSRFAVPEREAATRSTGDQLALTHRFILSAGQPVGTSHQDPLRMELYGDGGAAGVEKCSYTIADDRLTLFFPSQNEMIFERIG